MADLEQEARDKAVSKTWKPVRDFFTLPKSEGRSVDPLSGETAGAAPAATGVKVPPIVNAGLKRNSDIVVAPAPVAIKKPGTPAGVAPPKVASPEPAAQGGLKTPAQLAKEGHIFTNVDLEERYPNMMNKGESGGLDTSSLITPGGGGAPPAIETGSAGGFWGSLLGIAQAIGARRNAYNMQQQRFHQGIEITRLVNDIMSKDREYRMNKPYVESQTEYNKAHAGLATAQGEAALSKGDQLQAAREQHAREVASRSADAAARDGGDWNDAYDRAYNKMLSIKSEEKGTSRLGLPAEVKTTSQAVEWLMKNKRMTKEQAVTALRNEHGA